MGSAPLGFHVMLRLEDDRALATTVPARRAVARIVLAQGEKRGLLAFGAADNHVHAVLATDRAGAGAFALYVETALRWELGLGARFDRARIKALVDQRHAYSTFHYAHRQDSRHDVGLDAARDGTSVPDLLGLRAIGTSSIIARVRTHLPRVRREELVAHFPSGVFEDALSFDLDVLADAAAAALALPDLCGRSCEVSRARRAAVHVSRGVDSRTVADALGLSLRAVQSIRNWPEEPRVVRAVHKQALLRTAMKRLERPERPLHG